MQFAVLCAENREAVLELAADGQVLAMTPTGSETGGRRLDPAVEARLDQLAEVTGRSTAQTLLRDLG